MSMRSCPAVLVSAAFCILAQPAFAQDREIARPAAPYATAHAKPLDAKEELASEADDHIQYRVEFNGVKDDRVPGYLYVPRRKADDKAPLPAILLQYGAGGNKKTDYIVAVGKQFASRGYIVLTIDSPGQGERRGKDKEKDKAGDILGMLSSQRVMHYCGDYSRAIDYLVTRPDVDKERIGYVGISWGAITGITYCAYDERVKAVGSMVGGGNFLGLYSPKSAAKAGSDGSRSSDPVVHVAKIAPRPLLFVNVTKDQLILRAWAESLHKCAGPGAKVIWLETDHYFNGLDRAAICASVIDFMDKELVAKRPAKDK
jgi:dienelactone hydrolase